MPSRPVPELPLFPAGAPGSVCGQIERWAHDQGYRQLVGLDEAGRGPLAGPVVAAAVALPHPCPIDGIDDSKRLDAGEREALFVLIHEHALAVGVSAAEPAEIDEINILRASLAAMSRAWAQVAARRSELRGALVAVDGNQPAPLPRGIEQRTFVKGDARSLNIAAASIVAKVTRDRRMVAYHQDWPVYGFDRHKGYPTVAHREAIRVHGPCAIHRRSFSMPSPDDPPITR